MWWLQIQMDNTAAPVDAEYDTWTNWLSFLWTLNPKPESKLGEENVQLEEQ